MEKELNMDEIEKDSEEHLKNFSNVIEKEIAEMSKFNENDIDKLIKMIFENSQDVADLEVYSDQIQNKISKLINAKERLTYQSKLTKKDIFEENLINIFLVYNAAVLGIWLTSADVIEFLKKCIAVGIIGYLSYDVNANYFASDTRKEQAIKTIDEIDKYIEISRHDIRTLAKFREMYIQEINLQVAKLFEIYPQDKCSEIVELIEGMDAESLIKNEDVKKRIRTNRK